MNKIQGFYNIESEGKEYLCKLRGILKRSDKRENCTVGDYVVFDADGFITEVKPRKNLLRRPLVANIDYGVIQFAAKDPAIDYEKINILILNSLYNKISPVLIINKIDLLSQEELEEIKSNLEYLSKIDIPVFYISTYKNLGMDELKAFLKDKVTAFGGPSGVGKSSILNLLQDSKELKTGETSKRLRAGKHTTRDSKLLTLPSGGFVIDTPGFSSVDLPPTSDAQDLISLFPEFHQFGDGCKFNNCVHVNEPQCGIKSAVDSGKITKERYEFYKRCYDKSKNEIWNKY
ncbi:MULTISPECIES: ribosome small subunit-dependent GTPase A [Cetobacterium]|uniref:ribosome small subunit-dependent GTPase A n=1 Tax=Cetobacterium TaxID=180162 RepID=UPI00211EFC7F|nr:ribosome small subunit-dependent GTPase A [Cetobacterium somerae]WVJ02169.1 ribosome small subunit-dependent GTPase A [Cetobacterium somerae]